MDEVKTFSNFPFVVELSLDPKDTDTKTQKLKGKTFGPSFKIAALRALQKAGIEAKDGLYDVQIWHRHCDTHKHARFKFAGPDATRIRQVLEAKGIEVEQDTSRTTVYISPVPLWMPPEELSKIVDEKFPGATVKIDFDRDTGVRRFSAVVSSPSAHFAKLKAWQYLTEVDELAGRQLHVRYHERPADGLKYCKACYKIGHISNTCSFKSDPKCGRCLKQGHQWSECTNPDAPCGFCAQNHRSYQCPKAKWPVVEAKVERKSQRVPTQRDFPALAGQPASGTYAAAAQQRTQVDSSVDARLRALEDAVKNRPKEVKRSTFAAADDIQASMLKQIEIMNNRITSVLELLATESRTHQAQTQSLSQFVQVVVGVLRPQFPSIPDFPLPSVLSAPPFPAPASYQPPAHSAAQSQHPVPHTHATASQSTSRLSPVPQQVQPAPAGPASSAIAAQTTPTAATRSLKQQDSPVKEPPGKKVKGDGGLQHSNPYAPLDDDIGVVAEDGPHTRDDASMEPDAIGSPALGSIIPSQTHGKRKEATTKSDVPVSATATPHTAASTETAGSASIVPTAPTAPTASSASRPPPASASSPATPSPPASAASARAKRIQAAAINTESQSKKPHAAATKTPSGMTQGKPSSSQ
jgi:hypothetical protein